MKYLNLPSGIIHVVTVMILFPSIVFSGNVQLNNGKTSLTIHENSYRKLVVSSTVAAFSFAEVNTAAGIFSMLSVDGYGNRNVAGDPALPVFHKLIEVPVGATFSVVIVKQHYRDIDLPEHGMKTPVIPAQPSMSKGDDPSAVPFIYHKETYFSNGWIADDLAAVRFVGTMRALTLARLDISPVQYNPVEKKLRIYDVLDVEIVFENANLPATLDLKNQKASPYFASLYRMADTYKPLPLTDELVASAPVTYVIVSDPMFQTALQPFVDWKKKKGFRVIEGYTSNPLVGTTTTSIKAWLQGLYNTPPAGFNAPSFVLFVGDVEQIPAWAGNAGSHYTDLRYCEYTNDNFPEVYYGRFSATSVAQLQPQIDKTLEYEKYLMPDPSFLNEAVMAAGADASFQTHSNGQIYYGTENYFNASHGILSHTYLQPEPSGANYSQSIHANVSAGVAYANYTAHCSQSGWASPSFLISDIPGLTNAHKYCLMVGNCCLSCKFDVTSFAEEQLRAADKGSVGYIGGSNNTYWDEDYWWGCGFKTVALHPPYDPAHIGAYDGTFHDHGEPTADWFVTQGQMVVCGNYAVEESSSGLKQYYWEIYHLMGDPSLMIYYSVPPALTASYQSPLMVGMTSLAVNTVPYAYIALSMNGTLLDARMADASGLATLGFPALSMAGTLDIVITKQNRQPHISTIQVIPASGPYVVYFASSISDPLPGGNNNGQMESGETNQLNLSLKNVGVQVAPDVLATLSTTSPFLTITDNTENYGNLDPDQTVAMNNAFSYAVAGNIPDQQVVLFTLHAVSGTNSWNSEFSLTANAPAFQVGAITVQDNGPGCNNDGILDPGETANLLIVTNNTGHAGAPGVNGTLSISGGTSPFLVINNATYSLGTLPAGGSGSAVFSVTADASTPVGTPVDLDYSVTGGGSGQYGAAATRQVVIGLIPSYILSNTAVTACVGNFFDTGGEPGEYLDSENFTETFYPTSPGSMIRFTFTSFSTETGYDFLKIYNGTSTSAPLIGTYHGTTSPGTITASNASGALTFNFTSDGSVTRPGWSAVLSCFSSSEPPVADFSALPVISMVGQTVAFTDLSSNYPTSWAWSFSPADATFVGNTGASSQNPQVQFSMVGPHTVTLTASNANGSDTEVKTSHIQVTNCIISAFPWTEGFENSGIIPTCWTQEQVSNPGINWTFIAGNGGSYPAASHGGTLNACLKDATAVDNKTLLVSPKLNLSGLPQPQLKFWHTQALWSPDQDQLSIYYKESETATWTPLATYTGNLTAWTQETIPLPGTSETYYIAFEGNAKYGYGVCIDDVEVSSACDPLYPVSVAVTASANPVPAGTGVIFTAIPANGGSEPSFQWKLNGTDIAGATAATYSYIPANEDVIECELISSLACGSGNPAVSNAIVMTVTTIPATISLEDITLAAPQCFDAAQTITVAGNGHLFTVVTGGYATMIAGQNIFYLPGTSVLAEGYMHGYIAPEGPFCTTPLMVTVIAGVEDIPPVPGKASCLVYPNPTTGNFQVVVAGFRVPGEVYADIYSMQGKRLIHRMVTAGHANMFSLSGNPAGIYLVRIYDGNTCETIRVVKQQD